TRLERMAIERFQPLCGASHRCRVCTRQRLPAFDDRFTLAGNELGGKFDVIFLFRERLALAAAREGKGVRKLDAMRLRVRDDSAWSSELPGLERSLAAVVCKRER